MILKPTKAIAKKVKKVRKSWKAKLGVVLVDVAGNTRARVSTLTFKR